jgi:hypothetical protein
MVAKEQVTIIEYVDVAKRAEELGCTVPTGFALLPRNFTTAATKAELVHEDTVPTVRALWAEKGLTDTRLEKDADRIPYIEEDSSEWVGPIIFIGAAVFSESPHAISVALSIVANYLTDYFKGRTGKKTAKLSIVVSRPQSDNYQKIQYEGPPEGIAGIEKIIKEIRTKGRRR